MVNDGSSLTEIGKFAIHVYSQSMFMDVAGFRKLFRLLWLRCCSKLPDINSGPRFVLNLIKVFEGSFGGATLYENPNYITPNAVSESFILLRIAVLVYIGGMNMSSIIEWCPTKLLWNVVAYYVEIFTRRKVSPISPSALIGEKFIMLIFVLC